MNVINLALIQTAAGPNPLMSVLPMVVILGIFYFLIILPNRRQQKVHQEMVASLNKGDQVVTAGGIIGEIVLIKEEQVTVRSGTSTFIVERGKIARRTSGGTSGSR